LRLSIHGNCKLKKEGKLTNRKQRTLNQIRRSLAREVRIKKGKSNTFFSDDNGTQSKGGRTENALHPAFMDDI